MAETVRTSEEELYARSGWNLNNISSLKGSVGRYIETNISGMKVCHVFVGGITSNSGFEKEVYGMETETCTLNSLIVRALHVTLTV